MSYTTLADVKSFLGMTTNEDDTLLSSLIPVAQAHIDAWCGRSFAAEADTTRYFAACPPQTIGRVIYLDQDLCAVSSIVNGEPLAPTDYRLHPADAPYSTIHLTTTSGKAWTWGENGDPVAAIAITGRWAYAITAPPAIVHATKEIVGWLYRQPQLHGEAKQYNPNILPPRAALLLETV